jgi:predicted trehalose synthase
VGSYFLAKMTRWAAFIDMAAARLDFVAFKSSVYSKVSQHHHDHLAERKKASIKMSKRFPLKVLRQIRSMV